MGNDGAFAHQWGARLPVGWQLGWCGGCAGLAAMDSLSEDERRAGTKAWSQNLGHEGVLTTFLSYGQVADRRQGEIMRSVAMPQLTAQPDVSELAKALFREMRDSGMETPVR